MTPTVAQALPSTKRRLGGGFLAGAGGRLLPASVPFRWFGTAIVCHALAWIALAAGAAQWPGWRGGPGWPLAALHLVTLGTLVASAIGASLQLLPVATRQPVHWPRLAALLWWLFVPGLAALVLGMGLVRPAWMTAGAALLLVVLGTWTALLALNLRGAKGMPGVVLHGWGAVVSLLLLIASAAALVAWWNGSTWAQAISREALRALHASAGVFGVMGLLVLGLSTILLPMFALASVPDERVQLRTGAAAVAALVLAIAAAFAPGDSASAFAARSLALAAASLALAWHVRAMRQLLASGMRGDLGRCTRQLKLGWGAAALALLCAALALARSGSGHDEPWGALFVLAAVGGWVLSVLFGVLQRILPFLASMHAARGGRRRPPTPSALSADGALRVHEWAHPAALVMLAAAITTHSSAWLLAAAACGFVGALGWLAFFGVLMQRLRRAAAPSVGTA